MAGIEIRAVTEDEFPAYAHAVSAGFGGHITDDVAIEDWRRTAEIDRTVAAFDRGRIVATAGAFTLDMTMPGLSRAQVAGVTCVTVHPSHRRKGLLTRMMRHQLTDVIQRGESLASLYASEAIIYGRFGYGRASEQVGFEIERPWSAFRAPVDDAGAIYLADKDEAAKVLPDAHEKAARGRPGDILRTAGWWENYFKNRDEEGNKEAPPFYAVHETKRGEVDGYATYRVKGNWEHALPNSTLELRELVAADPKTEAALWRFVLDVDLIRKVSGWGRPVDDTLRWLLADSRRLRVTSLVDQLWMRVLDVPAALTARGYTGSGRLVIEVRDAFLGVADGRYAIDVDEGVATVKRVRTAPDLSMEVVELGAAFLGATRFASLVRAGRVDEKRAGAAVRADSLFTSYPAPFCATGF